MTDKYDFKAALEAFNNGFIGHPLEMNTPDEPTPDVSICEFQLDPQDAATITTALRLADRLQSGEVSEEMTQAGQVQYHIISDTSKIVFKAMAAQMIKEESE